MPLQQFDERRIFRMDRVMDASFAHGTYTPWNGPPQDWRLDQFQAVNYDSIDHNVRIAVNGDAPTADMYRFLVPAGAGTGSTPAVDVFALLMASGFHYDYSYSGDVFYLYVDEAITSGGAVGLHIIGGLV